MKIKRNNNLILLADKSGNKDLEKFSAMLIEGLVKRGVIEDSDDFYGKTLKECPEARIADIVETLHEIGIEQVSDEDFNAMISLVFMGEGDCPECGGDIEVIGGGARDIDTGEYEYEDEICPICGYVHRIYNW